MRFNSAFKGLNNYLLSYSKVPCGYTNGDPWDTGGGGLLYSSGAWTRVMKTTYSDVIFYSLPWGAEENRGNLQRNWKLESLKSEEVKENLWLLS